MNRKFVLSKVYLENIDANNESIDEDNDSKDNQLNVGVGYCKIFEEEKSRLKFPLVVKIEDTKGLRIQITIVGYFKFVDIVNNEEVEEIAVEKFMQPIWPYVIENVASITFKMGVDTINLPPLEMLNYDKSL